MRFDPRTKLLTTLMLTSLALMRTHLLSLLLTFLLAVLFSWLVRVDLLRFFHQLRRLIQTFLLIMLLQVVFIRSGQPLLSAGEWHLVYSGGLQAGGQFFLRMLVILVCGAAMATASSRDMIQGLVQLKLPYPLAFMATTAIGFIPMLSEEIRDTLAALQLRGVPLGKLRLRRKFEAVTHLFFPVLLQTLDRAHALSIALEMRGFSVSGRRTSWRRLHMRQPDYGLLLAAVGCCLLIVFFT